MKVVVLGLPLLLAAFAVAGCGRSGDRARVEAVAERFEAAVRSHDGARACALLSDGAREALEQDASQRCARAAADLKLSGGRARQVVVHSTEAGVTLASGEVVYLETTPEGWRVSAAGCREPGRDRPADCELAA